MATTTCEDALRVIEQLTPEEKRRLREALAAADTATHPAPRESLYGIAAHLGPAPSAEEIDQERREAWANFLGKASDAGMTIPCA